MDFCVLLVGSLNCGRSRRGVLKRPDVFWGESPGELWLGSGLGSGLPMSASVAAYSWRRVACTALTIQLPMQDLHEQHSKSAWKYVTQATMRPTPVELQALASMQSDLAAGDRVVCRCQGRLTWTSSSKQSQYHCLKKAKDTRFCMMHVLTVFLSSSRSSTTSRHLHAHSGTSRQKVCERTARAGNAGRARAGSCQEMQPRRG